VSSALDDVEESSTTPSQSWFHAVNIATLGDAKDQELADAPIQHEDGRGNRWEAAPAITRHP